MNKKVYIAAGAFAVVSLAFLFALPVLLPGQIKQTDKVIKTAALDVNKFTSETTKLAKGAFGSLSNLDSASNALSAKSSPGPSFSAGAGLGAGVGTAENFAVRNAGDSAGLAVASPVSQPLAAPSQTTASDSYSGQAVVGSAKMIMPPAYSFKYVYTGDKIDLKETQQEVFRRLKGGSQISKDLAGLINTQDFGVLDLKSFSNLSLSNLSLSEDKDLGLLINFDFNEDSVYIYENSSKWSNPERDACGSDQACWDRFRMTIDKVPSDESLIAMASQFITGHQIDVKNYAAPIVDNAWREDYARIENKNDFYVPEYASVIYPLKVGGVEVRDQSGSYSGLRVNINLLKSAVSGLYGLTPYRYESSSYDLETDFSRLTTIAENGGWNRVYYYSADQENSQTIELGTPSQTLVQYWKYTNGLSEELFVPALIFPITKAPAENYYGPKSIVVPLVKEMVDELSSQPEVRPMPALLEGAAR